MRYFKPLLHRFVANSNALFARRPFALLACAVLPFMIFSAQVRQRMYTGEDEGDQSKYEEHSAGGIAVESLLNIRTVASLTIEEKRIREFREALQEDNPTPIKSSIVTGYANGLGQLIQLWDIALLFWWGGWLLFNYSDKYTFRDYLISMFSLFLSVSGIGVALNGLTNRDEAQSAAERIFELIGRKSLIDPLDTEGRKID